MAVFCAGLNVTPAAADDETEVCVLVPHFKDEYWLSVGYGLEQEANHHDVTLLFFEAGGYQSPDKQITQMRDCAKHGVDAILLGAVSSDHPELLATVQEISDDLPVFGLVNALSSDALSGRIGVDWKEMGLVLGRHLAELHPAGLTMQKAVLVSGPIESGWVGPLEKGLQEGLTDSSVEVLEVFRADTGLRHQLDAVEKAFSAHPDADILIGSAPAVEAAIGLIRITNRQTGVDLAPTYISHTIKRAVMNGRVLAVPFDNPRQQGILAIQQMLRVLEQGRPAGFEGPEILLISGTNNRIGKVILSPADYFPVIQ